LYVEPVAEAMDVVPFHRIAVATDGSESAKAALEVASDLAKRYGADLLVIAVAPLPTILSTPNGPIVPPTIPRGDVPVYRGIVDAAVARARSEGVAAVSGVCEEGSPVDTILAQVRDHRSELLVVGSRGLSTAERLLLGSVSTALVNHAPCPVLVVRIPTTPAKPKRGR
jgi:nucleotide-binding universal stress UspA family protein